MPRVSRVLVANRGEIAVRIIRACHARGVEAVLAVSEADRSSVAARMADRTVCIGPAPARQSYLNGPVLVTAALALGVDAIHPGYGFLAENPTFASMVEEAGITFIGPTPEAIRTMGSKSLSRELAERAGVAVSPASPPIDAETDARAWAEVVGFPLLVKASAGGGGKGIRLVLDPSELASAVTQAQTEAATAFGDPTVFLERYVTRARHVEIQVFGDGYGRAVTLGARDCSLQRRHQKMVEESRGSHENPEMLQLMSDQAVALAEAIDYRGAGTVEYIVDVATGAAAFLEMNTRIQVEHPVTEMVTGADLVGLQIAVAEDPQNLPRQASIVSRGHAVECRVLAEDPSENFRPSPGTISEFMVAADEWTRVDSGVESGSRITPHYDSMVAKIITTGDSRSQALARMEAALATARVTGISTNIPLLQRLIAHPRFRADEHYTTWLDSPDVVSGIMSGEGAT
jgi:acetyl-CoA carboxylase, biotin carboxylase subunit